MAAVRRHAISTPRGSARALVIQGIRLAETDLAVLPSTTVPSTMAGVLSAAIILDLVPVPVRALLVFLSVLMARAVLR